MGDEIVARAVAAQEGDPASLLHFTRAMIALRKANPALRHGRLDIMRADDQCLAFRRVAEDQALTCIFNLSPTPAPWPIEVDGRGDIVAAIGDAVSGVALPRYAALLLAQD